VFVGVVPVGFTLGVSFTVLFKFVSGGVPGGRKRAAAGVAVSSVPLLTALPVAVPVAVLVPRLELVAVEAPFAFV
jgi:hypothetical protein